MENHMTLHPIMIAIVFVIFAILSLIVMLRMAKQGKYGLAGFMFISVVVMVASAVISGRVPAQ